MANMYDRPLLRFIGTVMIIKYYMTLRFQTKLDNEQLAENRSSLNCDVTCFNF